jgi:hypothetical protein
MLTFPGLKHHQIAYVTTDMDEALRRLDKAFGLDSFYFIDTEIMRSYEGQPSLLIALVRTGGTEFEVILPRGKGSELWSDPLPKDGSFALLFHHIAFTVHGTMQDYERYRASFDVETHPIVTEGWSGNDARWFYTDERATLGHFIEHCWFSPEITAYMTGQIPVLSK